jgi:hypothetical protein
VVSSGFLASGESHRPHLIYRTGQRSRSRHSFDMALKLYYVNEIVVIRAFQVFKQGYHFTISEQTSEMLFRKLLAGKTSTQVLVTQFW